MREIKAVKRIGPLLLAAVLSVGLFGQPLAVKATVAEKSSGSYTKNGTFHIDQFGEYDINTAVTVTDGKISDVDVSGENFGGTYAEVNKGKLATAVEGIMDKFVGLLDTDADGIRNVDVVSGATYSSNGIKGAVADALDLDIDGEGPSDVPSEKLEAGTYDITVAVRSDVIDHSLVETDTTQAVLQVDEDGKMTISYRMVSGTDREPMYILDFNGYYKDNDPSQELTLEGASYSTEERNGYTVVTDVRFPLSGMSQYYYCNNYLYVPAMSNLNGEISGILFDHGKFNIKTIVTMHWDTLKKAGGSSESSENMQISASIEEKTSSPSYVVTVPSSISMGDLSIVKDNVKEYEIGVSTQDKEGAVTVSAPGGGELYSGKNSLDFSNDFGTQTFTVGKEKLLDIKTDTGDIQGTKLKGKITITGEDVSKAAGGNYTGTTTFTIRYQKDGETAEALKEGRYTIDITYGTLP